MIINEYRNALRNHLDQVLSVGNLNNLIVWDIKFDETNDPTLLSFRAYGSRDYVQEVLIASGVNGIWERLPEKRIALPTMVNILALKKRYGV